MMRSVSTDVIMVSGSMLDDHPSPNIQNLKIWLLGEGRKVRAA